MQPPICQLLFEPVELRIDIPAISANALTQRLREMEAHGVVLRRVMPTSPPPVEYALTALGQELQPVIEAVMAVGHKLKGGANAAA